MMTRIPDPPGPRDAQREEVPRDGRADRARRGSRTPGSRGSRSAPWTTSPPHPEVVEDADTFAGNARKKAVRSRPGARCSGSSPTIPGWRWTRSTALPGVLSARYAGEPCDDEANNRKLLEAVAALEDERRGAAFRCALALADPVGGHPARGRRLVSRTADPRAPGCGRVRIRPAVPDPGISPDVRRAQPARQTPAQPPRPGLCPSPGRPRPHDRPGRARGPGRVARKSNGKRPRNLTIRGRFPVRERGACPLVVRSRGDTRFRAACPGVRRRRSGPRVRPPAGR